MKTLSMMRWTLLALIPGSLAYACIFGVGILINILVVCGTAVATEAMVMHLRGQSVRLLRRCTGWKPLQLQPLQPSSYSKPPRPQ